MAAAAFLFGLDGIIPDSWTQFEDDVIVIAAFLAACVAIYRTTIRPFYKRVDRWLDTREEISRLPAEFKVHLTEAHRRDEELAALIVTIRKLQELIEQDKHPKE